MHGAPMADKIFRLEGIALLLVARQRSCLILPLRTATRPVADMQVGSGPCVQTELL